VHRFRAWRLRLLFILSILGPGFITANVDNDAGGIYTYASAGAQFGYSLLWTMIPIMIALAFAQEISARMAVITGKGLSELIREEYGIRIAFLMMAGLVLCNLGDVMSEFAGVASSLELFGVSKYVSVPLSAALVWFLVVRGDYKRLERVFLFASFLYLAYILTGFLARPDWTHALAQTARVPSVAELRNPSFLYLSVAIIGATIAPWQQFYLQASIVDKGSTAKELKYSQIDAVFGSVFSVVVAGFIVIACAATLHAVGQHEVRDAADAALSLKPLGGEYAFLLFSVGLFNASIFAACILPLSTAYTVCEALGFESGLNKRFREAPVFYWLFTLLLGTGAAVILIPGFPLVKIAVLSQVLNGLLLPFVLVFMLLLVNKVYLMGRYTNPRLYHALCWAFTAMIIVFTAYMLWHQ
jgi:NRAMP (natural resistance-associated macrophage protein)-like metal ion transporter